ncbi:MAG TPA: acetyl-CoA acetyltransferase [Dehalococcoidia bacterium]|nr:acetyl-CoA acetyltransferase [Dehalococcoidia bacterium]
MHGRVAVVGVGESQYYKRGGSPHSEFQLANIAIRNAVADAGLNIEEVDGLVSYMDSRNEPVRLSAALGLRRLNFTAQTWGGGGNGTASAVAIADAALTAGYATNIVVFRALAQGQFGRFGQARGVERIGGEQAYTYPYGLVAPAHTCAMQTRRFMHEYGVTQDALAAISLASYAHAQRNPRALRYGRPLTREEYDSSRWIAEPFHLFDCCPENDGAAAAVLTTAERARSMRKKPAYIRAAAQGLNYRGGAAAFNSPDFPTAYYAGVAEQLWPRAGVRPEDVDVAQFYENFTGPVVMAMSEMGFAPPDGIEEFVTNGNLEWPNGKLPLNTSGGNLAEAYIHGFELIVEAVRQIQGESTCQVPDAKLSLTVAGPGFAPGSAILFSSEP